MDWSIGILISRKVSPQIRIYFYDQNLENKQRYNKKSDMCCLLIKRRYIFIVIYGFMHLNTVLYTYTHTRAELLE